MKAKKPATIRTSSDLYHGVYSWVNNAWLAVLGPLPLHADRMTILRIFNDREDCASYFRSIGLTVSE